MKSVLEYVYEFMGCINDFLRDTFGIKYCERKSTLDYSYIKTIYRRSGFDCDILVIANCEFF